MIGAVLRAGQTAGDSRLRADALAGQAPEVHVARAKAAAGNDYQNLFNFLCTVPTPRGSGPPSPGATADEPASATQKPAWYVEPVKVFDNLYFVGQSEYSAWAVTTSEGIILIDTLFDYSVEEEVAGGLKKLALDPAMIRYAVVTHPHPDHHGGAKFLQDRYKTRVLMSAADWDVIDRLTGTKPARDMVATDGQTLTLGDTTITLYITPGHTPGTLSALIPVRDNGTRHLAALWGGTGSTPIARLSKLTCDRLRDLTTSRRRPAPTSSCRTTPTGTARRSICRSSRSASPTVRIRTSSAHRRCTVSGSRERMCDGARDARLN